MKSENLHRIFLIFTIPAAVFLFYPSFAYYFFQDDWFVLNWVQNSNWLSLANLRDDIIYWRPISMPIFFKTAYLAFGLAPFFFHLITFIFHLVNSALIYFLFRELKFTKFIAAFIAFLYATASFHFIPLSWLSTTSYVIGTTFILSALIFFLKNKLAISFILFLLGLASSELTLTVIPIAFLLSQKTKKAILTLIPFVIMALAYLAIRFFVIPLPQHGEYELTFAPKIATNLFWYFAAAFNMPEAISTVFYFSNISGSWAKVSEFWKYFTLPVALITSFLILILKAKIGLKPLATAAGIFLAGLSPVIFLPFHFYPMYIVVASLGIFYAVAYTISRLKFWQTQTVIAYTVIWLISSFLTLTFTRTNHWITNLESISKAYSNYTKNIVKDPPENSSFLFRYPTIEFSQKHNLTIVKNEQNIRQALNDQDATQVIYKDKSLKSFYETDSQTPQIKNDNLYEILPRE